VARKTLKSVTPAADTFSNKEKRTFSRIRANQSTREAINTSLWSRKTKPASTTYQWRSRGGVGWGPRAALCWLKIYF